MSCGKSPKFFPKMFVSPTWTAVFSTPIDKLKLISALSLCYRGRMRSRGIRLFISMLFVYRG